MQHDNNAVVRNMICHPENWNGIIGGDTDPVCLGHPCDDDEELYNTEGIEEDEFSGANIAQRSISFRREGIFSV